MAIDAGAPPSAETIVVRSVRLPEAAGDPAFSIIRLSTAELEASPRLDEALSAVPGFSLFRRTSSLGANPTTQGVSLRAIAGSGASRALVTLDGVPQNDPFGGWVIWTALAPDTIESAEVVRGAGAGPYGAGALTGVVELSERSQTPQGLIADVSAGSLGDRRGEAVGDINLGKAELLVSAAGESTDGWIPVRTGRGAADQPLVLHDWSTSARLLADVGQGVLAARLAAYDEDRGAGLVGAGSRASGEEASLAYAKAPTAGGLGFRLQGWVTGSNLLNTSVAVAADRSSTTPANDQYSTPAVGFGFNGALRRAENTYSWELGADFRDDRGESHEFFRFLSGAFTRSRVSGGETMVGGVYAEGSHNLGAWLLTGGVRVDGWGSFDAHRIERNTAGGAITLEEHPADRDGVEPTARLALRRDMGGGFFVRSAAYAGFRPATLNELHRPFRVGNDITEANPGLSPEKLYGIEAGVGGEGAKGGWSLTAFANRLDNAITNVTIGVGPFTDPVAGLIPAGGTLRKRENAGRVDAFGLEGEVERALTDHLKIRAAIDYTNAFVNGESAAPQLTGLRPALTPQVAATAGVDWRAAERLTLSAQGRYESQRFDDDQNTRPIAAGLGVDARAEWRLSRAASVYLAAENLFDAAIQTGRTASAPGVPGVVSYDAPRVVRIGFRWRP